MLNKKVLPQVEWIKTTCVENIYQNPTMNNAMLKNILLQVLVIKLAYYVCTSVYRVQYNCIWQLIYGTIIGLFVRLGVSSLIRHSCGCDTFYEPVFLCRSFFWAFYIHLSIVRNFVKP